MNVFPVTIQKNMKTENYAQNVTFTDIRECRLFHQLKLKFMRRYNAHIQ